LTACPGYFCGACALIAVALIYGAGERFWLTPILLFGPTWLLGVLVGGAACALLLFHLGRVLGLVLLVAGVVVAGAVLAFNIPLGFLGRVADSGPSTRIVTWNIDGRHMADGRLAPTRSRLSGSHRCALNVDTSRTKSAKRQLVRLWSERLRHTRRDKQPVAA